MDNFIYVIADPQSLDCVVIDPAWDLDAITSLITTHNYKPRAALITHGHRDHTNALHAFQTHYDVPAYLSMDEHPDYRPEQCELRPISHGDTLQCGSLTFLAHHTPGHSPGCICFEIETYIISGDSLFIDGCGHCRMPHSDVKQHYHSLQYIKTLNPKLIVCPGHNYGKTPTDTIENQCLTNPYLLEPTLASFIQRRMQV